MPPPDWQPTPHPRAWATSSPSFPPLTLSTGQRLFRVVRLPERKTCLSTRLTPPGSPHTWSCSAARMQPHKRPEPGLEARGNLGAPREEEKGETQQRRSERGPCSVCWRLCGGRPRQVGVNANFTGRRGKPPPPPQPRHTCPFPAMRPKVPFC